MPQIPILKSGTQMRLDDIDSQIADLASDLRAAHERMDRMGIPRLPLAGVEIPAKPGAPARPGVAPFILAFDTEARRNIFAAISMSRDGMNPDFNVDFVALAMRHLNASGGERRANLIAAAALIVAEFEALPNA